MFSCFECIYEFGLTIMFSLDGGFLPVTKRGARAPACSNHLAPAPLNPSGVAGMIFKVIGTASMSIGSSDSLYFFSSFQSVPSLVCGATALLACYRHQTPSHQIDT